jgi:hypothetical protein
MGLLFMLAYYYEFSVCLKLQNLGWVIPLC